MAPRGSSRTDLVRYSVRGMTQPYCTLTSLKDQYSRDLTLVRTRSSWRDSSLIIRILASLPPSSGVSLSPPFVHSIAFSEHGVMAASTADGRVWVGRGGDKSITPKKKRSRKWEGLKESEGIWVGIAEGPVVSVWVEDHPHREGGAD